jgi:hypothetical protein
MPRIVFAGKVNENGKLYWETDNAWDSANFAGLNVNVLCFVLHLDGRLNGPTALKRVEKLLDDGVHPWLEVRNTKGCVHIDGFREWLFNSINADVLLQLKWLSAETVQSVEKDWEFNSTQLRSNHQWKTSVGLCIAPRDVAPQVIDLPKNRSDPARERRSSPKEGPQIDVSPVPPSIQTSLNDLRQDHLNAKAIAFVMMKFGTTKDHDEIISTIRTVLKPHKIVGLRADDKQYNDSLYENI